MLEIKLEFNTNGTVSVFTSEDAKIPEVLMMLELAKVTVMSQYYSEAAALEVTSLDTSTSTDELGGVGSS